LRGREHRNQNNAYHQGAYASDHVGQDAEEHTAQRPTQEADHSEQTTPLADVGRRGGTTEHLGYRRFQHQREQVEIRRIEGPTEPYDEKHAPLVTREAEQPGPARYFYCLCHVFLPAFEAFFVQPRLAIVSID